MEKSICDNCTVKGCLWKAETGTLDPPIMDCEYFERKITNADKIRAMSDEELALYIHDIEATCIVIGQADIGEALTVEEWLDWLKQEVEE